MGFKEDADGARAEALEAAKAGSSSAAAFAVGYAQAVATLALVEVQEEANRIARAQVYASLGLREQAVRLLDG